MTSLALYSAILTAAVVVTMFARSLFRTVRVLVTKRWTRDLGQSASDWARSISDDYRLGLEIVAATDQQTIGHYDDRHKTLALGASTYFGRTIASWAIAAHELGHALIARIRWLAQLRHLVGLGKLLSGLGMMQLLFSLFLNDPSLLLWAERCIGLAIVCHSGLIVEELAATLWGGYLLMRSRQVRTGEWCVGQLLLGSAWLTYVAAPLFPVFMLLSLDPLGLALSRIHLGVSGIPNGAIAAHLGALLALVVCILSLWLAWIRLFRFEMVTRPETAATDAPSLQRPGPERALLWVHKVLTLLLLPLGLVHLPGALSATLVPLASVLLMAWFLVPLALPLAILAFLVAMLKVWLIGPSADSLPTPSLSFEDIRIVESGSATVRAQAIAMLRRPHWTATAAELMTRLSPLPLALAYLVLFLWR